MVAANRSPLLSMNVNEHEARAEWRRLCFVLEGVQATHLLANVCDKYVFARTYLAYLAEEQAAFAHVKTSIGRGNFDFFVERGVPTKVISHSLAYQLLRDWRAAMASKRARIETAFEGRFGEDIGEFVATPRNAKLLHDAPSLDDANAVSLLGRWAIECRPAA